MESATMPSTPTFLQRMERGLSPAAAMITLHRDLTLRLENHMSWQAVVFLRVVDDPENFWYRCKLCRKWLDVTHLQSQIHSSNMQGYMREGNPHLTAEHPLEAIPRNYREACIEGYAELDLRRIAEEFRRIVQAERHREPKAKQRPKQPPVKAKAPATAKSARAPEPSKPKTPKPPVKKASESSKPKAPEPPVRKAPEAFRRGVWMEEDTARPPVRLVPASEVSQAEAMEAEEELWGDWRPLQEAAPPEAAPPKVTSTAPPAAAPKVTATTPPAAAAPPEMGPAAVPRGPPLKKPRIPWAPPEPPVEGAAIIRMARAITRKWLLSLILPRCSMPSFRRRRSSNSSSRWCGRTCSGRFQHLLRLRQVRPASGVCSSAQADAGLAVQYSGATSGSEVLSERQPGPVKGVPTLSVCHSERQLGSEKGVPSLPVCQALEQVGQLVACPVCQSVVQSPGSQPSQLRAQPDHRVGRSVCSSVCESCGSLCAAVADCRSGSRSVGRSLFPLQDNQLNNPIPQMQEPNTQPERGPAVVEVERDVDPNLLLAVDDGAFGEIRSKRDELQRKMAGRVPFQGGCEVCSRARGLTPARKRASTNISTKEMQVDQFFYRKAAFVILVHTLSFSLAVAPRPLGESPEVTASHLEPWIRSFSIRDPEIKSDPEGLTKSIAAHLCNRMGGFEESFAPERHAPVAERGVRSLKGLVSTQILELRESGIEIPDGDELHEVLGMLFSYAAHCHNRFQVSVGSTMTPLQKVRGHKVSPQLTYPFGTVVFAKVSKSTKKDLDS